MSLEPQDILKLHQRDRDYRSDILDERITDLHFARWGQADDVLSEICTTEFNGQYDILSKERKRLQAEFRQNEIEVKFRNKNSDNDQSDEIMQGKYRTDRRLSKSKQCFQIAQDDLIDCGYGAWRFITEEEDEEDTLNTRIVVRREAIPEAIRKVFWDCNSNLLDKSDASRCSIIHDFDEDGYHEFLRENDIDEDEVSFVSFDQPYESIYELFYNTPYRYPFFDKYKKNLSILEFYNLEPIKTTYYQYIDEEGTPFILEKSDAKEMGLGEPIRKRTKTQKRCFKYLFNGIQILKRTEVPGGMIPVVPAYAERNFVNGVENFFGLVKAAKDPQILINSAFNYMASMMMFSPVPKPEYDPREIENHEHLYEDHNNHTSAYHLRNKYYTDDNGEILDFSNPTYTQPVQMPPAVATLAAQLPGLMEMITNPGITKEAAETSISGVALQTIQEEIGIMSYIILDNWGESMRRDGEIYASMSAEIDDVERKVILTNNDGTTREEIINKNTFQMGVDEEGFPSVEIAIENKIAGERFDIHFDVGPSYSSRRQAVLANLKELYNTLPDTDPIKNIVLLNILSKQDGEGMDEINKMARFDLLSRGLPGFEPQTEEEQAFLQQLQAQQAQQGEQPDPNVLIGIAENKKADAAQLEAEVKVQKNEIDAFNAETKRLQVEVDAQETGADITKKEAETSSIQLDNAKKTEEIVEAELRNRIQSLELQELLRLGQSLI